MIYSRAARRDLLIKVAKMYYLENLSQQQIANKIKASRSNVSKMLQSARDLNIVQIRIDDTSTPGFLQQTELMETFDISQAIVIPSMKDPENTKMEVGRAAADLLQLKISDGMRIGITWGSTIYHVVNQFNPKPLKNAIVYQLMGGTGARDPDTDGREQTQSMANKLKAKSYILQAPLIVQSKQLRNLLLKEPVISQTLKEAEQVDLAITSLGTNDPINCNLLKLGHFTRAKCRELRKRGAVGDLCGWHLDINGQLCELDLHDRIVGISLEQISRIKTVIAVAIGERKAEIILACLRGGYIDYLVTDELAAIKVLSLNKG